MKKICILISVLLIFQLSGCVVTEHLGLPPSEKLLEEFSETNGSSLPITESPTKLTLFTESGVQTLNDKLIAKSVKDITGIDLEIIAVSGANVKQKLQMLFASKQIPDLFNQALDKSEFEEIVQKGMVVGFDTNLDKMPNIKSLFFDDPEVWPDLAGFTSNDGHVYYIPGYNIARDINHGFLYRKDIFDKHQIKLWDTTEEFYQALKQLKGIYPASVPFVSKKPFASGVQGDLLKNLSAGWGLQGIGFYFDEEEQSYLFGAVQPEFKQMLDFLKRLYDESLIDQEFLTSTEDSWMIKMTQENTSFVTFDWIDRMDSFYEQVKAEIPGYDLRFAPPIGPKKVYQRLSKVGNASIAISNNDKKEISMKFVDFLLSPAGAKLMTLGVEGKTYEVGQDGSIKYLGFEPNELVNIHTLEEKYGMFTQSLAMRFDDRCLYYQYSPKLKEAQSMVNDNQYLSRYPERNRVIKGEYTLHYNELYNKITGLAEQFVCRYILAKDSGEAMWQQWLAQAKDAGVDEMTRLYNE